jgi:Ca2+-binding EF-hand superfamily protein
MSIGGVSGSMPDYSSMRAQMQDALSERFKADDTDESGGLSLEEFTEAQANRTQGSNGPANIAGKAPPAEEMFAQLDADGDGQVTETELSDAMPPAPQGSFSTDTLQALLAAQEEQMSERFAAADTDQSGELSLDEFTEMEANRPKGPGGPEKAGGPPPAEEVFDELDLNGDGQVSEAELAKAQSSTSQSSTPVDTLATLLSAQEDSGSSSIMDILNSASKTEESSETDLLSQLLGSLEDDE